MYFRVRLLVRNVVFFLDSKVRWFTTWEGEENKKVEECELENINHHSAKGHLIMVRLTQGMDEIDRLSWTGLMIDLKWSKVGVHRKDVDKLQGRKYVCRSEKTLKSMSEPTWKCHYIAKYVITRSLWALRTPTSSWRLFGPLDYVLRALQALRPCDPHQWNMTRLTP